MKLDFFTLGQLDPAVDDCPCLPDLLQTMRGFPPLQIFVLGLLFGLLAVPLAHLTGQVQRPEDEPDSSSPHAGHDAGSQVVKGASEHPEGEHRHVEVPALIRVRFAHRPLSVSLKSEGRELLSKPDLSASPAEVSAKIEVSHDGNEFNLEAAWPPGTPDTALTVEIEPEGLDARTETRWSTDVGIHEILTFSW
jgi:hypothetical protein